MGDKVHVVVVVDSEKRNTGTSASRSDFIYQLTNPVNFHKKSNDKQYFVRAENINLPISFYSINSYNNSFVFDESTGASNVSVVVPAGNYTIDELIAEIQTQMNAGGTSTYTLTYDDNSQKVNIASDGAGGNFSFDGGSSNVLLGPLGFTASQTITGASNTTGINVAYTNTIRYVKLIVDNITSSNMYDANAIQKLMFKIPITETRNEFQFYDNQAGYKIKLSAISTINEIRVKLLDPDNHVIDLNGCPWSFDLVFYEWNRDNLPKQETDKMR